MTINAHHIHLWYWTHTSHLNIHLYQNCPTWSEKLKFMIIKSVYLQSQASDCCHNPWEDYQEGWRHCRRFGCCWRPWDQWRRHSLTPSCSSHGLAGNSPLQNLGWGVLSLLKVDPLIDIYLPCEFKMKQKRNKESLIKLSRWSNITASRFLKTHHWFLYLLSINKIPCKTKMFSLTKAFKSLGKIC